MATPGGWGYFEEWQTGVTEIAGWVGVAEVASLEPGRRERIWGDRVPDIVNRVDGIVRMLLAAQQRDGGVGTHRRYLLQGTEPDLFDGDGGVVSSKLVARRWRRMGDAHDG